MCKILFSVVCESDGQPNVVVLGREGCGRKGENRLWKDLCLSSPTAARAIEVVLRRVYSKTRTKCLHPGAHTRVMPAGSGRQPFFP
jgi:hypothetical protein